MSSALPNDSAHQEHLRLERELGERLKAEFAGMWVAVRDHQVIESAELADDLYDELSAETEPYRSFRVAGGEPVERHVSQVTAAFITPECRANRTDDGAFDEAALRLRRQYHEVLEGWRDAESQPTLNLILELERPA